MSWFKIDDKLPDNRKARAVRRSHREKTRDVAPFGLWALAGAWSEDGWVPLEWLEDWDDEAIDHAGRLVDAGLWHRTERDGEIGYVFHDWHDQNPIKDDNDPSSAGTFGNHVRWHVQRQLVDPDCGHCPVENTDPSPRYRPDDRPDVAPTSRPDIGYVGGESLPSRPDPTATRPDPTEHPLSDTSDHGHRFDEFWTVYDHKVGRKKAEQRWATALRKPGITADLLIDAARTYIAWQRSEGKHPTFTKHPATWLNGEHWRDERTTRPATTTRVQEHLSLVQRLAEQEQHPQIGGTA